MNELTKRLLAEGWTRENHPDNVFWGAFDEGFEYKWEYKITLTWQTGCGLFVQGRSVGISNTSYMGVHYTPENGNPLIRCPYRKKDCEHSPAGLKFPWCPCRLSQTPYDYDSSVEKLENEQSRREHEQWMEITGGQYCACVVGSNGYQGGHLQIKYNVDMCIQMGCKNEFCSIRKKQRNLTKVWLKTKQAQHDPIISKHIITPKRTPQDRQQEYFSKYHRKWPGYDYFEFYYDVENIRIEKRETRDLLQDLQDVANGIEVVHQADLLKAAKQKKSDNKAARVAAKERAAKRRLTEKILAADDELAEQLKRIAWKQLGAEEAEKLYRQRADQAADAGEQMTLFGGAP